MTTLKQKTEQPPNKGIFNHVSGAILAGGKSRRFGQNKALVELQGIPLIERVITVMGSLFEHLILITNTPQDYDHLGLPMYEDMIKGLGPVGGIYTALEHIPNDVCFVTACDMPWLNRGLIRYMVKKKEGYDAVIPRISHMFEALHSLYGRECLPAIKALIASDQRQVQRLFPKIRARYVEEDEIRAFDPHLKSFFNVNIPGDLVDEG
jgi:molybdopterin-guanine dinucleotide biosynthesis protein A